jgi:phage shock protein C
MEPKRLYRSRSGRMICGVCAGIARYFGIDPSLVRLVAVLAAVFSAGLGALIAYVVCTIIIPEEAD